MEGSGRGRLAGHTLWKTKDNITKQALSWNLRGKHSLGRSRRALRREVETEMAVEGYNCNRLERMV